MTEYLVEKTVCQRCYAILDAADSFCRYCGQPAGPNADLPRPMDGREESSDRSGQVGNLPPAPARAGSPPCARPGWSDSPWVVLPLVFLVLGPFGLPVLWKNRRTPLAVKIVSTAVLAGAVVVTAGLMFYVMHTALAPLKELDKLMPH
jgi:hypothetical protein